MIHRLITERRARDKHDSLMGEIFDDKEIKIGQLNLLLEGGAHNK